MHVEVNENGPSVHEATDLKRLAVVCGERAHLDALGDLGTVDGDHVWLSIDALREAAGATVPDDERAAWAEGFDGMIAFAAKHGWVQGPTVRAHIE
ncbi:MAG: hypothetical protein ACOYMR_08785 [Ilumatobacteraceae bacterium]|jgi:hypothetical protein